MDSNRGQDVLTWGRSRNWELHREPTEALRVSVLVLGMVTQVETHAHTSHAVYFSQGELYMPQPPLQLRVTMD